MGTKLKTVDEAFQAAIVKLLGSCPNEFPDYPVKREHLNKAAFFEFYCITEDINIFGSAFQEQMNKKWKEANFVFSNSKSDVNIEEKKFELIFEGKACTIKLIAQTESSMGIKNSGFCVRMDFITHRPVGRSYCTII